MNLLEPVGMDTLGPALPEKYAFESIRQNSIAAMEWKSELSVVLAGAKKMAERNAIGSKFWYPSRIVRAIIDSSVDGVDRIAMINNATRFALGVFAGKANPDVLEELTADINDQGLATANVQQENDDFTRKATRWYSSKLSAIKLSARTDRPILFVPICHGGFASGLQTFLLHQRERHQQDGILYPIRYSTYKHHDTFPRISRAEIDYLQELACNRTVVLYDEDAASGESIRNTMGYLEGKLDSANMIGLVNIDNRPAHIKEIQGEWWEKRTTVRQRTAY